MSTTVRAEPAPRRRGCLHRGCCGCFGLVALLVVAAAISLLIVRLTAKPEDAQREQRTISHSPPVVASAPPGHVELDLTGGRFAIEPVVEGSPVQLLADYDLTMHDLTEGLTTRADGSWRYEVRFVPRGGPLRWLALRDRVTPTIRVLLPRGTPLSIRAEVDSGESDLELGGLTLTQVELTLSKGQHRVRFTEPLAAPLERFTLDGSMGQVRVDRLGNASPRSAALHHELGECRVSLDGAWRNASEVDLDFRFGEMTALVPQDLPLVLGNIRVSAGETTLPDPTPAATGEASERTVRLTASGQFGELSIERVDSGGGPGTEAPAPRP